MECFKINSDILFAILSICMIDFNVVNGINVYMNENVTAVAGEGGIEMTCSYTKENVKTIFTVVLSARNQTTYDDFYSIVTFIPGYATGITPSGEYLRDRITLTNITQESTEATLIFNELKCNDQNQYRCKVSYLKTNNDVDEEISMPTTINITAKPQKPQISSYTNQQNHNIEKRSNVPSGDLNRTSIYQTTSATDHNISSVSPARVISEKEVFPQEGDNLTFVCSGNVGRPPGNIMWQTIYMNETISFKDVNGTMQTEPFRWKCSFNRTSYLTIQLSAKDFNARIRCFVVSHDGNNRKYVEAEPLKFYFGVRHVSINKLPDKQRFDTTIKNITLTCNGDGNPTPKYAWYKRKNNTILSTFNKYIIKNIIKNNSGTYICEVHNSFNSTSEESYNASASVEITIENKHGTTEHNNKKSEMDIKLVIGGFGGFSILAVIFALGIYRCRAKRKRLPGGNAEPTSESFSKNCARDNPCYTSDSETNIDHNIIGCENALEARNCTLKNEEELKVEPENKEIDFGNPTNQTNNEAASYAYVTISSDSHAGKVTNIDSQEILMSRINEKNKPSTTASSVYGKEKMDEILQNRTENTCDNSPDQYASSVPGIYDELHDNRHKTDNGEQFDRMSELKSLHENRNESPENKEIDFGNPSNQTNNEAASYAYVTISSDSHAGKVTNIDSQEMLMSRINEKNKPSTTASSVYGKEKMNAILQNRTENTCDNSPDQYASSVPGIYDELHDNRHKTDNGEQFDRMSELKSLHENRNKSHPIHLENSRRGGYESVVIDGELPVISSENNGHDYDDLEMVTQHNKEYMHNQNQEEENRNKSPVPQETVEYAQVNEATKFKNKTKHNDKDQPTLDAKAETQEMINIKSEERIQKHDENADQFDTTNNGKNHDEADSSLKDSQRACNIKTFAHGGEGKTKVARVCPSIRSLARSEDYKQQGNTTAEIQDEINDISGQTVHNDEYVDITENLRKQQTNGDLESSNKYNQIGSYINPEFERKEYQEVDSDSPPCRSFHGLQDEGQIHQNSDKQPNNDNEKVHI